MVCRRYSVKVGPLVPQATLFSVHAACSTVWLVLRVYAKLEGLWLSPGPCGLYASLVPTLQRTILLEGCEIHQG